MGNETLFGQIATFMDNLHVTYHECVYEIPYRNLLLMQADKARVLMSDEYAVTKGNGVDMMRRRMGM